MGAALQKTFRTARSPIDAKRVVRQPISYLPRLPDGFDTLSEDVKRAAKTAFTTAKMEIEWWVQRDPDPTMNSDTIRVILFLLHSVNMKTLQCNPSQATIADELNLKQRTVERCIAKAIAAGWIASARYDRNSSNWYLILENADKARAITDRIEFLREARSTERQSTRLEVVKRVTGFDPSVVAVRTIVDPSVVAAPDPSVVADKHLTRTREDSGIEGRKPIKVISPPLAHDPDQPFEPPATQDLADETVFALCDGFEPSAAVLRYFRVALMDGKLTPAMINQQRRLSNGC